MAFKGEIIQRLMATRGLKQREVIEKTGLSQSHFSDMQNDKKEVSPSAAVALARLFDVTTDVFIDPEVSEPIARASGENQSPDLNANLLKVVIDATNAYNLTSQDRAALIAAVYKIAIKSKMPDAETIAVIASLASTRG